MLYLQLINTYFINKSLYIEYRRYLMNKKLTCEIIE